MELMDALAGATRTCPWCRYEPAKLGPQRWGDTEAALCELGTIAQRWFEVMRSCGADVRELLHDGRPTACVGDAAFAYVNAFTDHVNVGFFRSAEIADAEGLLQGTGKFMHHVKLRPGISVDAWRACEPDQSGLQLHEGASAGRIVREVYH